MLLFRLMPINNGDLDFDGEGNKILDCVTDYCVLPGYCCYFLARNI